MHCHGGALLLLSALEPFVINGPVNFLVLAVENAAEFTGSRLF
jgi:hypothetical protein